VNEGNAKNWDGPTAKYALLTLLHFVCGIMLSFSSFSICRYVERCKFPKDGSSPKSLRYVGRYLPLCHSIFVS